MITFCSSQSPTEAVQAKGNVNTKQAESSLLLSNFQGVSSCLSSGGCTSKCSPDFPSSSPYPRIFRRKTSSVNLLPDWTQISFFDLVCNPPFPWCFLSLLIDTVRWTSVSQQMPSHPLYCTQDPCSIPAWVSWTWNGHHRVLCLVTSSPDVCNALESYETFETQRQMADRKSWGWALTVITGRCLICQHLNRRSLSWNWEPKEPSFPSDTSFRHPVVTATGKPLP